MYKECTDGSLHSGSRLYLVIHKTYWMRSRMSSCSWLCSKRISRRMTNGFLAIFWKLAFCDISKAVPWSQSSNAALQHGAMCFAPPSWYRSKS